MYVKMNRRDFMRKAGAAATLASVGLAGCTGSSDAPAPRKSNVVEEVQVDSGSVTVDLEGETWVESRAELESLEDDTQASLSAGGLASLSPVGVASAKGRGGGGGRGATGRGAGGFSKAPKTGKGRAKYYGGGYVGGWRDKHEDEIEKYPAIVAAIGFAFLGPQSEFEEDKPGPGPVPWDEKIENPNQPDAGDDSESDETESDSDSESETADNETTTEESEGNETTTEESTDEETSSDGGDDSSQAKEMADKYEFSIDQPGWYRIGTKLETPNGKHDFGWEAIDFRVEETDDGSYEVTEEWKVSPRL